MMQAMTHEKRAGSPHEAAEFAAMTKRDAQIRMDHEIKELVKLIDCDEEKKVSGRLRNCQKILIDVPAYWQCKVPISRKTSQIIKIFDQMIRKNIEPVFNSNLTHENLNKT